MNFETACQDTLGLSKNIERLDAVKYAIERQKENALSDRRSQLEIIDLIPKTHSVINALYDNIAGEMVKACEVALSDATHEIIGDKTDIGMDIHTKNGQISVDIGSAIKINEEKRILRSIVDGEGGGLTNVVCFSLRSIITARSGQRKFMVVDEPDCWLDNGKVDPLFNVIHKMATEGGFQIIALTHHDTSNFEDRANILTIEREHKGEATLRISGEIDNSLSRDGIIESIRLENFGGHSDLIIPLAPGLNFIRGQSNVGKSRVLRALRCVLLGEGNDGDISSDINEDGEYYEFAKECNVEIRFDGNRTLTWKRKRSGSPKESWSLYEADGNVAVLSDGTRCLNDRNGKEWAGSSEVLNIKPSEAGSSKLCAQLHTQKLPMFAINENGNVIASLLSIGKDAGYLREMLSLCRQKENEAKAAIKQIDRNLLSIGEDLMNLSKLDVLKRKYEHLVDKQEEISEYIQMLDDIALLHDEHVKLTQNINGITAFLNIIPEEPEFVDVQYLKDLFSEYHIKKNSIINLSHYNPLMSSLVEPKDYTYLIEIENLFLEFVDLETNQIVFDALNDINNSLITPEIIDTDDIFNLYKEYNTLSKTLDNSQTFIKKIPEDIIMSDMIREIDQLLNEYDNQWDIIDASEEKISILTQQIIDNDNKIKEYELQIGKCPTCGQDFPHNHKGGIQ